MAHSSDDEEQEENEKAEETSPDAATDPQDLLGSFKTLAELEDTLARGADPSKPIGYRTWVLHRPSVVYADLAIVRRLLDSGADPNARLFDGRVPLHFVESGEAVDLLVQRGADVTLSLKDVYSTPLHQAAHREKGDEIVDRLLAAGMAVDARVSGKDEKERYNLTALEYLVEYHANPFDKPLTDAQIRYAAALVRGGARVDEALAARCNDGRFLAYLMEHGVPVKGGDSYGSTALHGVMYAIHRASRRAVAARAGSQAKV
jgi:hypothetical protein